MSCHSQLMSATSIWEESYPPILWVSPHGGGYLPILWRLAEGFLEEELRFEPKSE